MNVPLKCSVLLMWIGLGRYSFTANSEPFSMIPGKGYIRARKARMDTTMNEMVSAAMSVILTEKKMLMACQIITAHPYISYFHSVHPTVHYTAVGQLTTPYPMQLSAIHRLVFLKDTPLLIYSLTKMESKNVFVVSRRPL